MHQLQWAHVRAASFEDALERFGAHVKTTGGRPLACRAFSPTSDAR